MQDKAERRIEQITISYKTVRRFALGYIAIPFFIFAVSWLSCLPAILCACCTAAALVLTLISNNSSKKETICFHKADDVATLQIHPLAFIAVVAMAALWVWWSGIGEGFYQSNDFIYRNAVFRDLINYDWPVIYNEEKGMLVYYIGFWLPAACVGKLCLFLTANADFTWLVGVFALYIWAFIGVAITFFMLIFCTKAKSSKAIFAVLVLFVFFSGMDIVGWAFGGLDGFFSRIAEKNVHIEWWAKILSEQTGKYLQYSSFTTQLFWVFNQSVITWICVLLLLQEKTPMHYIFIGMMCLFNGPLPFVGFFVVAMIKGVEFVWRHRKERPLFITKIFSLSNIFSVIGIFPVCLLYFTGNSATAVFSGERSTRTALGRIFEVDGAFSAKTLWIFIAFLLLEFGILALFLLKRKKTDPVFWGCVGMLTLFPFVAVGSGGDFCMRATIPALLCLCVYSCESIIAYFSEEKKQRKCKTTVALLCVLIIGSATPLVEFSRGVYKSIEAGCLLTYNELFFTLADVMEDEGNTLNFTSADYKDSNFYRLIAKKVDLPVPQPSPDTEASDKVDISKVVVTENLSISPKNTVYLAELVAEDFTSTGLTYDTKEDAFWIADHGSLSSDALRLIEFDKQFSSVICTVTIPEEACSTIENLQGIAYDEKADTIWMACGNSIEEINKNGEILNVLSLEKFQEFHFNGICYDSDTDTLWVLCYDECLINITKEGTVLKEVASNFYGQDMLCFRDGRLYITVGADYAGTNNYCITYDPLADRFSVKWRLDGSYAVEGIYVDENRVYIVNDGAYHNAKIPRTYLSVYQRSVNDDFPEKELAITR